MADLVGRRFGRLVVLFRSEQPGSSRYICRCDCGTLRCVSRQSLVSARIRGCGCMKRRLSREAHLLLSAKQKSVASTISGVVNATIGE
jgi:hypothetical protein